MWQTRLQGSSTLATVPDLGILSHRVGVAQSKHHVVHCAGVHCGLEPCQPVLPILPYVYLGTEIHLIHIVLHQWHPDREHSCLVDRDKEYQEDEEEEGRDGEHAVCDYYCVTIPATTVTSYIQ